MPEMESAEMRWKRLSEKGREGMGLYLFLMIRLNTDLIISLD
jgi:hypothetical protein